MKSSLLSFGLVLSAMVSICPAVLAGPGANPYTPWVHHTGTIYTPLQAPVSLPNLPDWNGYKSVFYHGQKMESAKRRTVGWNIEYQIMEEPGQVFDWYSSSLKQNGWKLTQMAKNARSIAAFREKDRTQVSISVSAPQRQGYKGTLIIGYTIFTPRGSAESGESNESAQNRPYIPPKR